LLSNCFSCHLTRRLIILCIIQSVCQLIVPAVTVQQLEEFLWQHIRCDLDAVHTAFGRSEDDVQVLMHSLFGYMVTVGPAGESYSRWQKGCCSLYMQVFFYIASNLHQQFWTIFVMPSSKNFNQIELKFYWTETKLFSLLAWIDTT